MGVGVSPSLDPADEVATWLRTMDEHDMEYAVLFPTGSGNVAKLRASLLTDVQDLISLP
jgi:hypothetical protein